MAAALGPFTLLIILLLTSCVETKDYLKIPFNEMIIPDTGDDDWNPGEEYSLIWSDEFTGPEIDTSVWSYETYETGWRNEWNAEWQDYIDNGTGGDNAFIQNGVLVIKASMKLKEHEIHAYDSARITTKETKSFKYGKIAARMALPFGQGVWPAFWMLSTVGSWPAGGEIDILELIGGDGSGPGDDDIAHGALHWSNADGEHASSGGEVEIAALRQFHVFEIEWTPQIICIGVDGNFFHTADITDSTMSEFRQPFYLLLNLAIGGTWGGYPDETTAFPQYLFVDWIRVYQ